MIYKESMSVSSIIWCIYVWTVVVCVCIYIYIYIYNIHTYITHTVMRSTMQTGTYVVCMCIYIYTYMHIYTHRCLRAHIQTNTWMHRRRIHKILSRHVATNKTTTHPHMQHILKMNKNMKRIYLHLHKDTFITKYFRIRGIRANYKQYINPRLLTK
jgi:hypothetical protein